MRDVCSLIWLALIGLFRSRASLQVEILTLRHQLNVLRRKSDRNWVMLLVDERCLQPDLVGADRIVPVASVAASRDLDASSSTQRAATQIAAAIRLHQHRPSGICRVVSARA